MLQNAGCFERKKEENGIYDGRDSPKRNKARKREKSFSNILPSCIKKQKSPSFGEKDGKENFFVCIINE